MKIKVFLLSALIIFTLQIKKKAQTGEIVPVIAQTSNRVDDITISENGSFAKNVYKMPKGIPMKSPDYFEHLNENPAKPFPGKIENADELQTEQEYYHGDLRLNKINVDCTIIGTEFDCIQNSFCGWCSSSRSCLSTMDYGVNTKCIGGQFIYGGRPNNQIDIKTRQTNYGDIQKYTVFQSNLRGGQPMIIN